MDWRGKSSWMALQWVIAIVQNINYGSVSKAVAMTMDRKGQVGYTWWGKTKLTTVYMEIIQYLINNNSRINCLAYSQF